MIYLDKEIKFKGCVVSKESALFDSTILRTVGKLPFPVLHCLKKSIIFKATIWWSLKHSFLDFSIVCYTAESTMPLTILRFCNSMHACACVHTHVCLLCQAWFCHFYGTEISKSHCWEKNLRPMIDLSQHCHFMLPLFFPTLSINKLLQDKRKKKWGLTLINKPSVLSLQQNAVCNGLLL